MEGHFIGWHRRLEMSIGHLHGRKSALSDCWWRLTQCCTVLLFDQCNYWAHKPSDISRGQRCGRCKPSRTADDTSHPSQLWRPERFFCTRNSHTSHANPGDNERFVFHSGVRK